MSDFLKKLNLENNFIENFIFDLNLNRGGNYLSFIYEKKEELLALEESELERIYDLIKNTPDPENKFLFFAHPTFEFFQAFLKDEQVFGFFLEYLEIYESSRKDAETENLGEIDKTILKQKIEENDFLKIFPELYKNLFLSVHGNQYSHFEIGKNQQINLNTSPNFLLKDVQNSVLEIIKEEIILKTGMGLRSTRGWERNKHHELLKVLSPTNQPKRDRKLILDSLESITQFEIKKKSSEERLKIEELERAIFNGMMEGNLGNWSIGKDAELSQFNFGYEYELNYKKLYADKRNEISEKIEDLTTIENGMLPIGLKIHCLNKDSKGFNFLKKGNFSVHNAGISFNLPPVGSFRALKKLMAEIEAKSGVDFFDDASSDFQIQVCFPGELDPKKAALLRSAVYISAPKLRHFAKEDLTTSHENLTGKKLTIYGAGVQNSHFEYWEEKPVGFGVEKLEKFPKRIFNRTDMVGCKSLQEVEYGQLVATLLLHSQYGGIWSKLGKDFESQYMKLLNKYDLIPTVQNNSWIKKPEVTESNPEDFFYHLEEIYEHVRGEFTAVHKTGERKGLIFEIHNLIQDFKTQIEEESKLINI